MNGYGSLVIDPCFQNRIQKMNLGNVSCNLELSAVTSF